MRCERVVLKFGQLALLSLLGGLLWANVSLGQASQPQALDNAVNAIVLNIRQELQKEPLLVCFVVENNWRTLPRVKDILSKFVERVGGEPSGQKRALWAVVAFAVTLREMNARTGLEAKLALPPTPEIEELGRVVASLAPVKIHRGPEEMEPVLFANESFPELRMRRIIVCLSVGRTWYSSMSDQEMTRELGCYKKTNTSLYFVAPETVFQLTRFHVGELQVPAEWSPTGKPFVEDYWERRERESPKTEVLSMYPPFGVGASEVPSGFPPYAYSVLAMETGGKVFTIKNEPRPDYDAAKLACYAPDIVSPEEYARRSQNSRTRKAIMDMIRKWSSPGLSLYRHFFKKHGGKQAENAITRAKDMDSIVQGWINDLEQIRDTNVKDEFAPLRWEANLDLNLALLYKIRFVLPRYISVLQHCVDEGFPKEMEEPGHNAYLLKLGQEEIEVAEGSEQAKMLRQAEVALDRVIEKHAGTPWAEVARREKAAIRKKIVIGSCYIRGDL